MSANSDMPTVDAASAAAVAQVASSLQRLVANDNSNAADAPPPSQPPSVRKRGRLHHLMDQPAIADSVDQLARLHRESLSQELSRVCQAAQQQQQQSDWSLDDLADRLLSETQIALSGCLPPQIETSSCRPNGVEATRFDAVGELKAFVDSRLADCCEPQRSCNSEDESSDCSVSIDSLLSACQSPKLLKRVRRLGQSLARHQRSTVGGLGTCQQASLEMADMKQSLATILLDSLHTSVNSGRHGLIRGRLQCLRRLPVAPSCRSTWRAKAALLEESLPRRLRRRLGRIARAALDEWLAARGRSERRLAATDPKHLSRCLHNVSFALLRYLDGYHADAGLSNGLSALYPDCLASASPLPPSSPPSSTEEVAGSIDLNHVQVVDDVEMLDIELGVDDSDASDTAAVVHRRTRRLRHRLRSMTKKFLSSAGSHSPVRRQSSPLRRILACRCLPTGLSTAAVTACELSISRQGRRNRLDSRPLAPPPLVWPGDIVQLTTAAGDVPGRPAGDFHRHSQLLHRQNSQQLPSRLPTEQPPLTRVLPAAVDGHRTTVAAPDAAPSAANLLAYRQRQNIMIRSYKVGIADAFQDDEAPPAAVPQQLPPRLQARLLAALVAKQQQQQQLQNLATFETVAKDAAPPLAYQSRLPPAPVQPAPPPPPPFFHVVGTSDNPECAELAQQLASLGHRQCDPLHASLLLRSHQRRASQQQLVVYAHRSNLDSLPWQLPGLLELRRRRDVRFLSFDDAATAAKAATGASTNCPASALEPVFPASGGPCLLLGDPLRFRPDILARLLTAAGRRDSRWPIGIRTRDLQRLSSAVSATTAVPTAATSAATAGERERLCACLGMLEASRWAVDLLPPGEGGGGGAGLAGCTEGLAELQTRLRSRHREFLLLLPDGDEEVSAEQPLRLRLAEFGCEAVTLAQLLVRYGETDDGDAANASSKTSAVPFYSDGGDPSTELQYRDDAPCLCQDIVELDWLTDEDWS